MSLKRYERNRLNFERELQECTGCGRPDAETCWRCGESKEVLKKIKRKGGLKDEYKCKKCGKIYYKKDIYTIEKPKYNNSAVGEIYFIHIYKLCNKCWLLSTKGQRFRKWMIKHNYNDDVVKMEHILNSNRAWEVNNLNASDKLHRDEHLESQILWERKQDENRTKS